MKPVFQSIVCPARGDCQSAAIASIMELPIAEVPPWVAISYDEHKPHLWYDYMITWLRERGLFIVTVEWSDFRDWRALDGVFCIASVPSQKFANGAHAVVGTWDKRDDGHYFRIAHDPRPDNAPYPDGTEPKRVQFLVPINPRVA